MRKRIFLSLLCKAGKHLKLFILFKINEMLKKSIKGCKFDYIVHEKKRKKKMFDFRERRRKIKKKKNSMTYCLFFFPAKEQL